MTPGLGETSLGLLQALSLGAASKEELSAAGNTEQAALPRHGAQPRQSLAL